MIASRCTPFARAAAVARERAVGPTRDPTNSVATNGPPSAPTPRIPTIPPGRHPQSVPSPPRPDDGKTTYFSNLERQSDTDTHTAHANTHTHTRVSIFPAPSSTQTLVSTSQILRLSPAITTESNSFLPFCPVGNNHCLGCTHKQHSPHYLYTYYTYYTYIYGEQNMLYILNCC